MQSTERFKKQLHRRRWAATTLAICSAAALALSVVAAAPAGAATPDHHRHHHLKSLYQQVNLVADVPGAAATVDPNLVNPWGLSAAPATPAGPGSPLWVSDNGTDVSTLYTGGQVGTPVKAVPLVVNIPGGAPTGQLFNAGSDFVLSTGGKTGPAKFIFASEDGDITAWNPTGVATDAVTEVHTDGAVYKGIAMVNRASGPVLLAADFHDNQVAVFDSSFAPVKDRFAFLPFGVPRGFAPFNIAAIGNDVYVSYAKQDAERHDDVAGPGNGVINVFDRYGHFKRQLFSFGELNSPWAMVIAPAGFGQFSGDLLVGNFGDGRIHAFDPRFGFPVGELHGTGGKDLVIPGLWGLLPGTGTAGATSDLWFSAGPDHEAHGLLGILRVT
ncbi:TIGR03118 family protein [Frankineae bacterium MT45]|nr:TIGR03118 family protein [Frankineae bacterium MT45]